MGVNFPQIWDFNHQTWDINSMKNGDTSVFSPSKIGVNHMFSTLTPSQLCAYAASDQIRQ